MTFRFLVSFHYHRTTDLQEIVDLYRGPCRIFADSGAFSAATKGAEINLVDYAAWLTEWKDLITVAATLDVIGDPQATRRNTEALEAMGHKVLPVFHTGTPWEVLHDLCQRYTYVALGGMVPYTADPRGVMRWLIGCFKIAREYGTVFHGFGQTRTSTLAALPFYSADSSTWGSGSRYGRLVIWDHRRARFVTVVAGDAAGAWKHAALLRDHGADPVRVGTPGFASCARRSREDYTIEDAMMRGCPARAYTRFGDWLRDRHQVPVPEGWDLEQRGTELWPAEADPTTFRKVSKILNEGTELYLADAKTAAIKDAARDLSGTELYLADGDELQLIKAARLLTDDPDKEPTT